MQLPEALTAAAGELAQAVKIGAVALHRFTVLYERALDLQERQARATEQALEVQLQTLNLGQQMRDELDAVDPDVKFVSELRQRVAGLGDDAPPPTAADQGVDHD